MNPDKMLMPSDVDRFAHALGLTERDVGRLAYPLVGERLSAWLGRAARCADVRDVAWLAVSLGLLGASTDSTQIRNPNGFDVFAIAATTCAGYGANKNRCRGTL